MNFSDSQTVLMTLKATKKSHGRSERRGEVGGGEETDEKVAITVWCLLLL